VEEEEEEHGGGWRRMEEDGGGWRRRRRKSIVCIGYKFVAPSHFTFCSKSFLIILYPKIIYFPLKRV
jgi:hypothetical protein